MSDEVTQSDLNYFMDQVNAVLMGKDEGVVPEIEVPRKIVQHFNRRNIHGFDEVGYFVYNGVKVYEEGKKDKAKSRDGRSMEQVIYGGPR